MAASHRIWINRDDGTIWGVSEWNVPLGNGRTVLPMSRSKRLISPFDIQRWVKRFKDVSASSVDEALRFKKPTA